MQAFIKTELLTCLREEQQQTTLKKVSSAVMQARACVFHDAQGIHDMPST